MDNRMYVAQDVATGEILPGYPTPALIDSFSRSAHPFLGSRGVEAWIEYEGIVRLRDDRHDPKGTVYTRVMVINNPEYKEYPNG